MRRSRRELPPQRWTWTAQPPNYHLFKSPPNRKQAPPYEKPPRKPSQPDPPKRLARRQKRNKKRRRTPSARPRRNASPPSPAPRRRNERRSKPKNSKRNEPSGRSARGWRAPKPRPEKKRRNAPARSSRSVNARRPRRRSRASRPRRRRGPSSRRRRRRPPRRRRRRRRPPRSPRWSRPLAPRRSRLREDFVRGPGAGLPRRRRVGSVRGGSVPAERVRDCVLAARGPLPQRALPPRFPRAIGRISRPTLAPAVQVGTAVGSLGFTANR
mmetsp:Transcript_18626/g.38994  ORF Transcript_18626/g.38994 Transcript_18626/m.38994 type:complete len:269 (+) Transcript_18626:155-961(+)